MLLHVQVLVAPDMGHMATVEDLAFGVLSEKDVHLNKLRV